MNPLDHTFSFPREDLFTPHPSSPQWNRYVSAHYQIPFPSLGLVQPVIRYLVCSIELTLNSHSVHELHQGMMPVLAHICSSSPWHMLNEYLFIHSFIHSTKKVLKPTVCLRHCPRC